MANLGQLDLHALLAFYRAGSAGWAAVMIALTILGSGWAAVGLVPLVYSERTRRLGVALAVAVGTQATLVWWLKRVVGRVRPWIALGLPAPIGSPHDGSFPSGHAAGAFCVAAFLVVALPAAWPAPRGVVRAVAGALLVLATSIASSRVYLGAHFPADVLCGALLGGAVGAIAGRVYAGARGARPADGPVERAPERG